MSLSPADVRWVAHLGRLQLSDAEVVRYQRELNAILDYVQELQQLDTGNVEPLAHPLDINNVFRPDELADSLALEAALANAPDRRGSFFGVPAVLD